MSNTTRYIVDYFKGEKQESFLTLGWGIAALAGAYYGYFESGDALGFGLAVPLSVIGILHVIVGASINRKTDAQIKDLLELRDSDPQNFKSNELTRMEKVLADFKKYRLIAQVLFIVGVIFVILGMTQYLNRYWTGVGLGMIAQGAASLFLDLYAELRGKEYYRKLSKE